MEIDFSSSKDASISVKKSKRKKIGSPKLDLFLILFQKFMKIIGSQTNF